MFFFHGTVKIKIKISKTMHGRIGCHGDLGVFNLPAYLWHKFGIKILTFSKSNNYVY